MVSSKIKQMSQILTRCCSHGGLNFILTVLAVGTNLEKLRDQSEGIFPARWLTATQFQRTIAASRLCEFPEEF